MVGWDTNKTPQRKFSKKPLATLGKLASKVKYNIGIILLPDQVAVSETQKEFISK